ncbi:MAG: phosphoglycerate kinase [Pseudomonadota bacterium]
MDYKTLDDLDMAGRRVLIRVDLNTPVKDGEVSDDTRLRAILPTVTDVLAKGGRPILLSHFGRPKGEVVPDLSLKIVLLALRALIDNPVVFVSECTGPIVDELIERAPEDAVILMENVRFYEGEEQNDKGFAASLARIADLYVNDAFSAAHRAHASTEAIAHLLPAAAGRLMEKELSALESALGKPERPVIAVVGGAKVSTKLTLLGNLLTKTDQIIIGGGMANTFLAAKGLPVGTSLCEHDLTATAREIMSRAVEAGCEIVLPSDIVVTREFAADAAHEVLAADACPGDAMILDAGPETIADIAARFETAKTVVWNGPLGAFEIPPFDAATNAAALKAAELTEAGLLLTVAGGGDTVAALNASGATARFSYVSTAGGAFLEWLEGKTLPGVAALNSSS